LRRPALGRLHPLAPAATAIVPNDAAGRRTCSKREIDKKFGIQRWQK
jgi:hypothetical protein